MRNDRTEAKGRAGAEEKYMRTSRGRGMKSRGVGGIVVMTALVLAAVSLFAGTAMGQDSLSAQEIEAYYQEKERALVAQAREFLNKEGFADSGVMLTRILDADGSREYTLTVHHGKIDRMCMEDRELLMAELEKMVFEDEDCNFKHEFFINQ